jgi:glycine oxidase
MESWGLHNKLAATLPEESGVDYEFRRETAITVTYSREQAQGLQERLPWQQAQEGFHVEWKEGVYIQEMELRLAPGVVGGIVTDPAAMINSYKFNLALLKAAEGMGAVHRKGEVTGINFHGDRVSSITVGATEFPCEKVVLAMGPWSGRATEWLGVELPVRPLKGQILRLQVDGAPLPRMGWGGSYATTKPDGLVWIGTTEEDVGFDATPTAEARKSILESAVAVLPYLADAQVVEHTACLRPVAPDGLPILGQIQGKDGLVVATGAGRKGILLGPAIGRLAAELVTRGKASMDISAMSPNRFISTDRPDKGPLGVSI